MKEKRYAILSSDYPSMNYPNVMGFVHSRAKAYKKLGINIEVFCISKSTERYEYEGILVNRDNKDNLRQKLVNNKYDAILIHFLDQDKADIVGDQECYIWVHGFEALSWKRRLFNLNPRLPLYIYENTKQLRNFKNFAKNNKNAKFIFVSEWMRNVTCADINYEIKNYIIIPNFIDEDTFSYHEKNPELRKKFLLIRSFANKKYANDLSIKFIQKLSKKEYFGELEFAIYGTGKFFNSLTNKIKGYSNIKIKNNFLTQDEVAKLHNQYGIFLCPTRQDAQGVSMCEAMSSGLIPLTSNNTAIPEFVQNKTEGLLCNNEDISSFVEAYETLYNNPEIFSKMSKNASLRMDRQCSLENTILEEIKYIEDK